MGPFAAGRCSYRGAERCSAFVVRPFRSEALLLQAILELLIRCRSSAPAANGAQRAPTAIDRRREEVSGGSNTQHQAPPGQSSRTDTISGFEEERANRKF